MVNSHIIIVDDIGDHAQFDDIEDIDEHLLHYFYPLVHVYIAMAMENHRLY